MNQVEINQLKTIKKRKTHAKAVFEKRIAELDAARRRILDGCDHKHPDGASAIVDMLQCNGCRLCGWVDMY